VNRNNTNKNTEWSTSQTEESRCWSIQDRTTNYRGFLSISVVSLYITWMKFWWTRIDYLSTMAGIL